MSLISLKKALPSHFQLKKNLESLKSEGLSYLMLALLATTHFEEPNKPNDLKANIAA